jgi:hypothetical protein
MGLDIGITRIIQQGLILAMNLVAFTGSNDSAFFLAVPAEAKAQDAEAAIREGWGQEDQQTITEGECMWIAVFTAGFVLGGFSVAGVLMLLDAE